MTRHSKRGADGRFTPADALDTGTVPDAVTWQTDVSGNPEGEHDMPGTMTQYPAEFASPRPVSKYDFDPTVAYHGHDNGRRNPYLGRGERATYRDSAGIPVPKPEQARKHYFLSPATNAIATRAQKDARIVRDDSYARNPEDLGDDY
jgi:hypothetical protein